MTTVLASAAAEDLGGIVDIRNIAKDNAQVGYQIGLVKGDFHSGSASFSVRVDLSAELASLRHAMAEARSEGEVDDASTAAFNSELDKASENLPITDAETQGGFIIAMKRAKGLAEGLADVTVKISAAIAAARGIV